MSIGSVRRNGSSAGTNQPGIPRLPAPVCVTTFLVGRNRQGQWVACERHGLRGGLFANQTCALRYALSENGRCEDAVILVSGFLELDMSVKPSIEAALPAFRRGDARRAA